MENNIVLSSLPHTWILDLDGTLVMHNGYKTGEDAWLSDSLEFLRSIPQNDFVLIVTGREQASGEQTEAFLNKHKIRYDKIIYDAPLGERILISSKNSSKLPQSLAINIERNGGINHKLFQMKAALSEEK